MTFDPSGPHLAVVHLGRDSIRIAPGRLGRHRTAKWAPWIWVGVPCDDKLEYDADMPKKSAGLLMFRRSPDGQMQVLLVHPGGPIWAKRDVGAWTFPKGEYDGPEDPLEAAKREFVEETGFSVAEPFIALGSLKQPSGKMVSIWAFEADCDPAALVSNEFEMEWPPKSGLKASFVEIDRAGWFSLREAREKLSKGQVGFLEALAAVVPDRVAPSTTK